MPGAAVPRERNSTGRVADSKWHLISEYGRKCRLGTYHKKTEQTQTVAYITLKGTTILRKQESEITDLLYFLTRLAKIKSKTTEASSVCAHSSSRTWDSCPS